MKNVLIILLVSTFLALVYNWSLPEEDQFPLIKKPVETVKALNIDDILVATNSLANNPKAKDEFLNVGYEQVKMLLAEEEVFFIDARPAEEYLEAKIGESINIFPYDDEEIYMQKILEEVPRGQKLYVIYCHGGTCDLSHMVAGDMKAFDITPIVIYTGGWEEWVKKEGIVENK